MSSVVNLERCQMLYHSTLYKIKWKTQDVETMHFISFPIKCVSCVLENCNDIAFQYFCFPASRCNRYVSLEVDNFPQYTFKHLVRSVSRLRARRADVNTISQFPLYVVKWGISKSENTSFVNYQFNYKFYVIDYIVIIKVLQ